MARKKRIARKLSLNGNPHKYDASEFSISPDMQNHKIDSLFVNANSFHVQAEQSAAILKKRKKWKHLLENEISETFIDDKWHSVFLLAASAGCTDIVSLLLQKGVFVDISGADGNTALHFAAKFGQYKIVKLLLENNSNCFALNSNGETPLCLASDNGHQRVVTLLSKAYYVLPEMEVLNESADTKLFEKIRKVVEKTIRVETDREFREQNRDRGRAAEQDKMSWAKRCREGEEKEKPRREGAARRHARKRKKLKRVVGFNMEYITADADDFVTDGKIDRVSKCWKNIEDKKTRWTHSVSCNLLTEELMRHFDFLCTNEQTYLHVASNLGFAELLPELARAEQNINRRDSKDQTALHKAAWNGHEKCVETLVQLGASVVESKPGRSALYLAAMKGRTECIKQLLKHGADVNFCDQRRQTALHVSAKHGYIDCVTILIGHGADITCRDKFGMTALHVAAKHGNEESVLALIDAGADIESQDGRGQTPLHVSAWSGQIPCISVLLNRGAEIRRQDKCRRTALYVATLNNQDESVLALVHKGADINARNNDSTPLHVSALAGHVPCMAALIHAGAELELLDEHGWNALHITSLHGHLVCILLLLEGGAEVNSCTRDGFTALHLSSREGFEECVSALLDYGANIHHRDKHGHTALHTAATGGHVACVDVLRKRGARAT